MITKTIAEFIARTEAEKIPSEARSVAKKCILNIIGCALVGAEKDEGEVINKTVLDLGGRPEAGIIGHGVRVSAPLAALANGTMAYSADYDPGSMKFLIHPAVSLVPAIIAVGEKRKSTGREILDAFVIAFEVGANLGDIMGIPFLQRGWHPTMALGTLGTTAAAARLLGLNISNTTMALGIGSTLTGGLSLNSASMTRHLHAGVSAHNGILAALLADNGMSAHHDILDGPGGFCEMFTGKECDFDKVEKNLGKTWYTVSPGVQFKLYPCCGGGAGCQQAILELKREYHISPDDVVEIVCRISPLLSKVGLTHPAAKTGKEGLLSLEYQMAIGIIDGDLSLKQFSDEKVKSPSAQELMRKVKTVFSEEIGMGLDLPQEVMIKLKGGKQVYRRIEIPKGAATNPLSDEEIISMFKQCASETLKQDKIAQLIELIWHMEDLDNIEMIMELTTLKGSER